MKRTRNYYRYQRNRAINRKFNILKGLWSSREANQVYDDKSKGKLSKGKVHCSCWMCRAKSYIELTHTDKQKLLSDEQAINDYFGEC